jgi:hypothetical protein
MFAPSALYLTRWLVHVYRECAEMERPVGDKGKPKRDREDNEEHLLEGASDTHLIVQNDVQQ